MDDLRINASTGLTRADVRLAAHYARSKGHDIFIAELEESPRGAITFYCESEHGRRATNRGGGPSQFYGGTGRAASWTAWGWLIADLFARNPMPGTIGFYKDIEDFKASCKRYTPRGENLKFLSHLPRTVKA